MPERRADLYEKLLELLVNKWEKARFDAKDCDDARRLAQHSLAEFLQIGQDVIRRVLGSWPSAPYLAGCATAGNRRHFCR
ncbi:MAG: hypothetical protein R3E89_20005 [Thiolinea sp.]